jgi:hypothetical protein
MAENGLPLSTAQHPDHESSNMAKAVLSSGAALIAWIKQKGELCKYPATLTFRLGWMKLKSQAFPIHPQDKQ